MVNPAIFLTHDEASQAWHLRLGEREPMFRALSEDDALLLASKLQNAIELHTGVVPALIFEAGNVGMNSAPVPRADVLAA